MKKFRLILAALAAAALLGGCAHPQIMDLGDSGEHIESELGAPQAKVALPDGGSRWVYSMNPFGEEVWWLIFDKDGKLVKKEQILDYKHFMLIKPGVDTQKDVWNLFGRYAEHYTFSLINQTAWMYRFLDEGGFHMACWVQFDTKGVVTEVGFGSDPWHERDGSALFP
ncbi:MAG: SmpA-OmlA domain-containing protein [Burkholderia sp.]|jgi:hypothetical protein